MLFDAVLSEATVFGDTNLELPSVVSNQSVVEVHMDVGYNTLSGKNNGLEINIEIPVHARYPVCAKKSGFFLQKKGEMVIIQTA